MKKSFTHTLLIAVVLLASCAKATYVQYTESIPYDEFHRRGIYASPYQMPINDEYTIISEISYYFKPGTINKSQAEIYDAIAKSEILKRDFDDMYSSVDYLPKLKFFDPSVDYIIYEFCDEVIAVGGDAVFELNVNRTDSLKYKVSGIVAKKNPTK